MFVDDAINSTDIGSHIRYFHRKTGRRPRILLVNKETEKSCRAVKMTATAYADAGFDVDISPPGQTVQMIARQAVDNDVHVVNVMGLTDIKQQLETALDAWKAEDIIVIANQGTPLEIKKSSNPNNSDDIAGLIIKLLHFLEA